MSTDRPTTDTANAWREHNLVQLRQFRSLSLRAKLQTVQDMADVVRHFNALREQGRLKHLMPSIAVDSNNKPA